MSTSAEPLTQQEEQRPTAPADVWSDDYARKIASADFQRAEQYRTQNHDWRFRNAEEIYLAWVGQKYWEGTRQPRSSLGVFVALEQIESLLPKVLSAIFGDPDWAEVTPRPGTSPDEARAVWDLLSYQADEVQAREVIRRALKSAYIYGNGIVELGWKNESIERRRYSVNWLPIMKKVRTLFHGVIQIPTDKKRVIKEEKYMDVVDMPYIRHVSTVDYYIDPNCPSPCPQEARFDAVRRYMTIEEVEAYDGQPGFKIPPKSRLVELARNKPSAFADLTKSSGETVRGNVWNAQEDYTADPAQKRIEVVSYTTKNRNVWLMNREEVMFNKANPYGFINHFNFWYVDMLDRFYALGVTDVVEGDQRLIQSLRNARVDEVALSIHAPTIKRRGMQVPLSSMRRRPGLVTEAENPETDIVREQVQNITQNAYIEEQYAQNYVQKATGITDLAVLGTPSSGGNSANRTATGINQQAMASASRLQYLVENVESTAIEPMLTAWHTLNQRFLNPDKIIEVLGDEGKFIQIDPLKVKNANVKFSMRASARMQSRNAILQVMPLIFQTFLNPEFLQLLATQQQMTVDVKEIGQMIVDAIGHKPRFSLFRKLSPQELQGMNQPSQDNQIKMQMQEQRLESQNEMAQEAHSAKMMEAFGGKVADHLSQQDLESTDETPAGE